MERFLGTPEYLTKLSKWRKQRLEAKRWHKLNRKQLAHPIDLPHRIAREGQQPPHEEGCPQQYRACPNRRGPKTALARNSCNDAAQRRSSREAQLLPKKWTSQARLTTGAVRTPAVMVGRRRYGKPRRCRSRQINYGGSSSNGSFHSNVPTSLGVLFVLLLLACALVPINVNGHNRYNCSSTARLHR